MEKNINNNLLSIKISEEREIEIGRELKIIIKISNQIGKISNFEVLFNRRGEQPSIVKQMIKIKEEDNFEEYCAQVRFNELGNYFFFFELKIDENQKAIKIDRKTKQPIILNPKEESPYWKILVTNKILVPQWAKDAIFYQIVVDRFCKSDSKQLGQIPYRNYRQWGDTVKWKRGTNGEFDNNDFFGGDIKGIISKLPYLNSLGVKVLYLSPINKSYNRYDGYATIDYMQIDSDFGDFETLANLKKEASKFRMYIVLDMAFNHCSIDNAIFKEARDNPKSEYRSWFQFDENGNYKYWYDFKDMPLFNQYSAGYQNYVFGEDGIIDKFAPYIDGIRFDLGEIIEPFFLEGIRNRMNACKLEYIPYATPCLYIEEAWERVGINFLGKGADAVTNYPISDAILKFVKYGYYEYLKDEIYKNEENYPMATIDASLTSIGTHDTPRALTMLSDSYQIDGFKRLWELDKEWSKWHYLENGNVKFDTDGFRKYEYEKNQLNQEDYQKAKAKLKVAAILQYFLPGNPCIFYGDEVGVAGYKDPFSKPCYPYGKEDVELLDYYKELGKFRNLYKGAGSKMEILSCDSDVFTFKRVNSNNMIYVTVNRGEHTRMIEIPSEFKDSEKITILSLRGCTDYLLPNGGLVILKFLK